MHNHNKKDNKSLAVSFETADFVKKTTDNFISSKNRSADFVQFITNSELYNDILEFDKLDKIEKVGKRPLFKPSTLKNILDCGSWLEYREYINLEKTTLQSANFCHYHKVCKSCAIRRSAKQVQKYNNLISKNKDLMSKKWYYIVLPIKHHINDSLDTVYNRLNEAIEKIRKSRKNKRGKGFFRQFDGIMIATEITKSKNGWNVHLNLLCCTDNEINDIYEKGNTFVHNDLIDNWKKVTDNDSYIVSINKLDFKDSMELKKNLLEIFKYTLKFSDMSNDDLLEVYRATSYMRLLRGWGIFYNLKEDISLDDDELIGEEYIELVLRYTSSGYVEHSRVKKIASSKMTPYRAKQAPLKRVVKNSKFVEIIHLDKYGNTLKRYFRKNLFLVSDYEIFSRTMNSS